MKLSGILSAAASAVIFFAVAASAGEAPAAQPAQPAAKAALQRPLQAQATAQISVPQQEQGDFDALSAVNDPLYREGSREFLKQVAAQDAKRPQPPAAATKAAPAPQLRDAPVSPSAVKGTLPQPHPAIKRPVKKLGPADPIKGNNTI